MIPTLDNIRGYRIVTRDGEIGKVHDFFIDDSRWHLRYIVVETGSWMSRRRVLLSLAELGATRSELSEFHVHLTCEQVSGAPGIDTDKPVSRQQKFLMNVHYGWPNYWSLDGLILSEAIPTLTNRPTRIEGDHHQRSFREISSYAIKHGENRLGKVEDFVIDDADWSLTNLVLTGGGWLDSRRIAIPASNFEEASWLKRAIFVDLKGSDLSKYEPFNYNHPVDREESFVFCDYHGRPAEPAPGREDNRA